MRLIIALMLLVTALPVLPSAVAHSCAGTQSDCTCPVPNDGKYHSHAGPSGSCTGGPGGTASATPGGASATPAWGAVGVVGALVAGALLSRRA